ncbi:MAG: GNAT family N-acetyltransferase [Alphaproteobacteria bacterium]
MIKRLTVDDIEAFHELREEAIALYPESFGSPEEEEGGEARDAAYRRWLNGEILGAFEDGNLVGATGFYIPADEKVQSHGQIFTVYVRAAYRKKGIGDRLLKSILDLAKSRVDQVRLRVVHTAKDAIKTYLRNGFEIYGTESRAVSIGNIHYDEILMEKKLK